MAQIKHYQKEYKEYSDQELRDKLVAYARFGLEANPTQIAKVIRVTRDNIYKIIKRKK